MRLSYVVVIAACMAGAATAISAEDRFGPSRAASAAPSGVDAYAGSAPLGWTGKTAPRQVATATPASTMPQQLPNGLLRNTSVSSYGRLQIAPSTAPAPQPAPRAAARPAPDVAPQPTAAPAPAHLPAQQVAAAPPPAKAPAKVALAGGPPAVQPAAATPAQIAQMTAPLPSALFDGAPPPVEATPSTSAITRARLAANAANSGAAGQAMPRLYSVHSGYGMVPDPIPLDQTGVGQVDVVQSGGVQ